MQKHKNDLTCTGEHYSLFVVRHVGTVRLDSLDKVECVESCRVESRRAKCNLGPTRHHIVRVDIARHGYVGQLSGQRLDAL